MPEPITERNHYMETKTLETDTLKPVFSENYVTIAANSSNEYVPYLSVYLESIKAQASKDTNYDVVILECSITDENKSILKESFETQSNLSLRFYNPSELFTGANLVISHPYLCKESYFRLSAPVIFKNYKKIIFTDVDLIFNNAPEELYNLEMNNAPILAVLEPIWSRWINKNATISGVNIRKYTEEILKLDNPHHYFNTGVMLMDIEKLNRQKYTNSLLNKLNNNIRYLYQDQDILNEVLGSEIGVLEFEWNGEIFPIKDLESANTNFQTYCNISHRNIIHWIGSNKPWIQPEREMAYKWWELARKSPYYEIILTKYFNSIYNQQTYSDAFNYRKNILMYWKYKILSNITFAKIKEKYMQKKIIYKRKILNGKNLRGIK